MSTSLVQTLPVELQSLESAAPSRTASTRSRLTQPGPVEAASGETQREVVDQGAVGEYPEGGYGWVVVLGCSMVFFVFLGLMYSWGVIQDRLVAQDLAPASTLAFVGSTGACLSPLLGTVSAQAVRKFGNRKVAFVGGSLVCLGTILAGFATKSVPGLFLTQGVMFGVGCSACFMSAAPLATEYFQRRRGIATGMVYAGGGVGAAAISLSMDALIDRFGVEWTFRILGLLSLAIVLPAASLLKPRFPKTRRPPLLDLSLFRDAKFCILILLTSVAVFFLFCPPFFLPLYASAIGLSTFAGAGLLAGWNLSSAVGRIVFGMLADTLLGPVNALFVSLLISGVSTLALWPVSDTLAPLCAFVAINGLGAGGFFSLTPTVVASLFKGSNIGTALGMTMTTWGAGYFLGAPIAGYILEAYGGASGGMQAFRPAIYYAGSIALASAVLALAVRFMATTELLKRV